MRKKIWSLLSGFGIMFAVLSAAEIEPGILKNSLAVSLGVLLSFALDFQFFDNERKQQSPKQ